MESEKVVDKAKSQWPYTQYVCGCYDYVGDIDAPHGHECPQHKTAD